MTLFSNQKEADEAKQFLIDTVETTLKISRDESERRVNELFSSGILDMINPLDENGQRTIDLFVSVPSRLHKTFVPDLKEKIKQRIQLN